MRSSQSFWQMLASPKATGRALLRASAARRLVIGLRHRGLAEQDVFLASYPKSGNTWLRHLVTYLVTREETDWQDRLLTLTHRVGKHPSLPKLTPDGGRLIKTHELYRPEYRRAIVLLRDGRDVAVSEYHWVRDYVGRAAKDLTFEEFLDAFLHGGTNAFGLWHKHAASWVDGPAKHGADVHLVRYEDLKRDPAGRLREIAGYLKLGADDELIDAALANGSVEAMRAKEQAYWAARGEPNKTFVRKAKAGGWRDVFTPELHDRFLRVAGDALAKCGYATELPAPAEAMAASGGAAG